MRRSRRPSRSSSICNTPAREEYPSTSAVTPFPACHAASPRCLALAQSHESIEALYARGADALIVTGNEPRAERLQDEPYWEDFARLVDWARLHTTAALWSCLAAHGAVLRLDGVERRRANEKIAGIFECEVAMDDWATQGAAGSILVPHSRYNGLPKEDLMRCGYKISSWSRSVEVDCFWRREPSLFLFTQGHPEYEANTLAREFRRDALRFLDGERSGFPAPPSNYFSARTRAALDALSVHAKSIDRQQLARKLKLILETGAPTSTSSTIQNAFTGIGSR